MEPECSLALQKRPLPVCTLSQSNPVHASPSYFLKNPLKLFAHNNNSQRSVVRSMIRYYYWQGQYIFSYFNVFAAGKKFCWKY